MSGSYDWDGGAESVEDSLRPVTRVSSPLMPRLTSTLLVPTTIPSARSLAADVIRPTDAVRPMRPARGTRPMIPSSVANRAGLLSTIRDRSRSTVVDAPADPALHASMIDASLVHTPSTLHDPNNEAPAARRSSLAISGSRRGLPSSLSQRAHMFASIRDRARTPISEEPALSENRTPEE